MTRSVEEQMADIERRMKQLRARKQRIVARENAKARKRRTHLIIRLGGILSNEGVLGYDEGVWNERATGKGCWTCSRPMPPNCAHGPLTRA